VTAAPGFQKGGGWGRSGGSFVVSEPHLLARVHHIRLLGRALEGLLWLAVAGSALAFGAVHPWAYRALWALCVLTAGVALARGGLVARLRRSLGAQPIGLHSTGRWIVKNPEEGGALTWRLDLGAPVVPRVPLLWPGLAFVGFVVALQLVPWDGEALTVSTEATRRGLAFVATLLALHLAAAVAFTDAGGPRRLQKLVAGLGFVMGFVALIQLATGSERIYGFFETWEGGTIFGPFVNRNHFAGYMLMVIPVGLGLLAQAWRRYRRRVGDSPNVRRRLVAMGSDQGTRLPYAALPPLVAIAALFASSSRGGILAFLAALALAAIGLKSRKGTPAWAAALVFVAVTLIWFGLDRLEVRFLTATDDVPGRTVVWEESVQQMEGPRWLTGYGLNTFAEVLSRVPAWQLPEGATPWPELIRDELLSGERYGYRSPGDLPGMSWYREAHNDYVQLLVETGLPGLALGLWGAFAALVAARHHPWLLAALVGPLLHALVDFDFQIPAIPVLFVVLAALAAAPAASGRRRAS
jgi:O-antigen ligase